MSFKIFPKQLSHPLDQLDQLSVLDGCMNVHHYRRTLLCSTWTQEDNKDTNFRSENDTKTQKTNSQIHVTRIVRQLQTNILMGNNAKTFVWKKSKAMEPCCFSIQEVAASDHLVVLHKEMTQLLCLTAFKLLFLKLLCLCRYQYAETRDNNNKNKKKASSTWVLVSWQLLLAKHN